MTRAYKRIGCAAGLILLGLGTAQAQEGKQQAGVSAAVRGEVTLLASAGAVGRQVESGEPIYLGNRIEAGPDSGMQVLLLDETVFTIGPKSEITIDEFVYDPATGDGRVAASMARGVMRFVTGRVAKGNPENMTIDLPVGSIGIRGTMGVVTVLSPDEAAARFPDQAGQVNASDGGPVVFAGLTGPGPNNNADTEVGAFNVSTPQGSVDLTREGYATVVAPDGNVSTPFQAPPAMLQFDLGVDAAQSPASQATRQASNSGGDGQQNSQNSQNSQNNQNNQNNGNSQDAQNQGQPQNQGGQPQQGQQTAQGGNPGGPQGGNTPGGPGGGLDLGVMDQANQQTGQQMVAVLGDVNVHTQSGDLGEGATDLAQEVNDNSNSPFTFEAMQAVTAGNFSFNGGGYGNDDLGYNFHASVDYGNRSVTLNFQNIKIDNAGGTTIDYLKLESFDFGGLSGEAVFDSTVQNGWEINTTDGVCAYQACNGKVKFKDTKKIEFELASPIVSETPVKGQGTLE